MLLLEGLIGVGILTFLVPGWMRAGGPAGERAGGLVDDRMAARPGQGQDFGVERKARSLGVDRRGFRDVACRRIYGRLYVLSASSQNMEPPGKPERFTPQLVGELEGHLGHAAFHSIWRRGIRHSAEETISLIGRALDVLSTDSLRLTADQDTENDESLTEHERTVLVLAAEVPANRRISSRMGIADRIAKQHLTAVFRKLGVSSREAAAAAARKPGIV